MQAWTCRLPHSPSATPTSVQPARSACLAHLHSQPTPTHAAPRCPRLQHIDLYRLGSAPSPSSLAFLPWRGPPPSVACLVEWPECLPVTHLPPSYVTLALEEGAPQLGPDARHWSLFLTGPSAQQLDTRDLEAAAAAAVSRPSPSRSGDPR